MTASMDRATADLIVAELDSLWPGQMDRLERERWHQVLRPPAGKALDPEVVGQTLLHFRHASIGRPAMGLFRAAYDVIAAQPSDAARAERNSAGRQAVEPVEPVGPPIDRPAALAHVAALRLILAGEAHAAQVFTMAGTL